MTAPDGRVLRADTATDDLAEKNIFAAFPALSRVASKPYVETSGSMPEAAGVRGRADAQWGGGGPGEGGRRGTWSLRHGLVLVRLRVSPRNGTSFRRDGRDGRGARRCRCSTSMCSSARPPTARQWLRSSTARRSVTCIRSSGLLATRFWAAPLEIEGRSFGVAVRRVAELGPDVAIAALRSET